MEPLLHHYFNGCYAHMSFMVPQTARIAAQLVATLVLFVATIIALVRLFRRLKRRQRASEGG
jgi:hypothetical protein